jgi:hypothetical protein
MKAALLAALVSFSAFAEEPPFYRVESGNLVTDQGNSVSVGKGIYLQESFAIYREQKIEELKTEHEVLKAKVDEITMRAAKAEVELAMMKNKDDGFGKGTAAVALTAAVLIFAGGFAVKAALTK